MRVTLLGTGTSTGVPHIGCHCPVCSSASPYDKRLRSSCLIDIDDIRILIDCGPDFREQMLGTAFRPLDAVLLTHEHSDHTNGLDDLRPNSVFGITPFYANHQTTVSLRQRFPYCFTQIKYPGVPQIELHEIVPYEPIYIKGIKVMPLTVMHGRLPILGFRIADFAYITDMKTIPEQSVTHLQGLKALVINGLRYEEHPTHQTLSEAVHFAQSLGVPLARLTHLNHTIGLHEEVNKTLPDGIRLGYDGEVFDV